MKREEKNQQTKRRIMESALKEFAEQGYGASSVNNICSCEGVSKGIIYHYFQTKDELYLACVDECFRALTEYLGEKRLLEGETVHRQLQLYFDARFEFFQLFPLYRRMFCVAVIMWWIYSCSFRIMSMRNIRHPGSGRLILAHMKRIAGEPWMCCSMVWWSVRRSERMWGYEEGKHRAGIRTG